MAFEDDLNFNLDDDFPRSSAAKSFGEEEPCTTTDVNFNQQQENFSHRKAIRRKFPGPAGLLPDKPPRSFKDTSLLLEIAEESAHAEEPILCSQSLFPTFEEPPFKRLKKDYELDLPGSPLAAVTIDWVKSMNLKGRKIPFLASVLESVDCSSLDPVLTLRDPTGALHGVLSADLWKEMGAELKTGAALVLKDVGIINNLAASIVCLNITKANILTVYTPESGDSVIVRRKKLTNISELGRNVAEWRAKLTVPQSSTPTRPFSFFLDKSPLPVSSPDKTPSTRSYPSTSANFDVIMDDADFDNLENFQFLDADSKGTATAVKASSDCHENQLNTSTVLSQQEAEMVNEVLADLEFDDFD